MPDPTLQEVLLRKATSIGPGIDSTVDTFQQQHPGSARVRGEVPVASFNTLEKAKALKDWISGGTIGGTLTEDLSPIAGNVDRTIGERIENLLKLYGPDWVGSLTGQKPIGVVGKAAPKLGGEAIKDVLTYGAGRANEAWRGYTGHNLIPSPTSITNKLLGRNDPNPFEK